MIEFVEDVSFSPSPTNLYAVADFADDHVKFSKLFDDDSGVHPPVILGAEITTVQSYK